MNEHTEQADAHAEAPRPDPLSPERQQQAVRGLLRRVAARAEAEAEADASFRRRNEQIERDTVAAREALAAEHQQRHGELQTEFDRTRGEAEARFQAELDAAENEHRRTTGDIAHRFGEEQAAADRRREDARWEASAVLDALQNSLNVQMSSKETLLEERNRVLTELRQDAGRVLEELELEGLSGTPVIEADPAEPDSYARMQTAINNAELLLARLKALRRNKLFYGLSLLGAALACCVVLGLPVGWMFNFQGALWILLSVVGGLTLVAVIALVQSVSRQAQIDRYHQPLLVNLAEAEVYSEAFIEHADAEQQRQLAAGRQRRDAEYARIDEDHRRECLEIDARQQREIRDADDAYHRILSDVSARRQAQLAQIDGRFEPRLAALEEQFTSRRQQVEGELEERGRQSDAQHTSDWDQLADDWRETAAHVRGEVMEINEAAAARFPNWMKPDWNHWQPPEGVPASIRFGEYEVDLREIPGGLPEDERLRNVGLSSFSLPAAVSFPSRPSMLYKAHGEGRALAVRSLQSVMLRLLTALPPGKVRFTIIDPVGLGENFAGFMHLADYEESLVNSRIWTEAEHIEQRLADLTEHLENVIQTYLRNEFQSIDEYNQYAGEVAEPFRVLVAADFPANFSEAAARRLISIAGSGPRCGVFTLVAYDTKKKPPPGVDIKDLEAVSNVLKYNGEGFDWQHDDFGPFPLRVDVPPGMEYFTAIVHAVGRRSRDANKVEVPFHYIAPQEGRLWSGNSADVLDGPLGRAGATKLQHLVLGKGTSQHVLVAGKTGSGKSTLLHILVTNLALHYSPEQLQLYLVDFKKGVEFKTYATHHLPHARVVAVESEREFGLSVLQRLDEELKRRGDAYRALGAQDLAGYRAASGETMPRILLLVDEFQEFFVEDDRIAGEASLLLDRLVRQGRAFGIHVLLGSQTLGGAYSLARSTLGQMAVRIALECSETDAGLILSEGNTAARLLSRPGEAIYNDANGRVEGNKPFQIAWLPEAEREQYLDQIRQFAEQQGYRPPEPQIVFEGNAPAELANNFPLAELLEGDDWPKGLRAVHAWFGEPVAIKAPTAAVFHRQTGSNLLVVGQREEGALGVMAASLASLAAQHRPEATAPGTATNGDRDTLAGPRSVARFCVLDGSRGDSPFAGFFSELARAVPHTMKVAGWRDSSALLQEVYDEVRRREEANDSERPAVYLVVYNLGRFRDLRRDESDFGFSGMSSFGDEEEQPAAPSPAKQLVHVLGEGSSLGVHTLLWADSLNALNRCFDRQTLREFELRVLFQLSADDSSNLIDTPAASKLGLYRGLLASEEQGTLEKFRPYDVPGRAWLDSLAEHLQARGAVQTPGE